MNYIISIVLIVAFLYWLIILRLGRRDFWKIANQHANEAYGFFITNDSWKVFENSLPDDYRLIVPKEQWTGPFKFYVPKLGNNFIYVFGRYPEFESSQDDFIKRWRT